MMRGSKMENVNLAVRSVCVEALLCAVREGRIEEYYLLDDFLSQLELGRNLLRIELCFEVFALSS